jgi:Mn-dependent DtxR family transcriptional regulator
MKKPLSASVEDYLKIIVEIQSRHETLRTFFIEFLGLDPEVADEGACRMEHALSPPVADRIVAYHHYLTSLEAEGILSRLDFLKKNRRPWWE